MTSGILHEHVWSRQRKGITDFFFCSNQNLLLYLTTFNKINEVCSKNRIGWCILHLHMLVEHFFSSGVALYEPGQTVFSCADSKSMPAHLKWWSSWSNTGGEGLDGVWHCSHRWPSVWGHSTAGAALSPNPPQTALSQSSQVGAKLLLLASATCV